MWNDGSHDHNANSYHSMVKVYLCVCVCLFGVRGCRKPTWKDRCRQTMRKNRQIIVWPFIYKMPQQNNNCLRSVSVLVRHHRAQWLSPLIRVCHAYSHSRCFKTNHVVNCMTSNPTFIIMHITGSFAQNRRRRIARISKIMIM